MQMIQSMQAAAAGGKLGEGGQPMPMMFAPQKSPSMDRQEKRKLINEVKEEMKVLITQICDY